MSGSYIKAHTDILEAPCKGNPILLSYKHYTPIVKNKVKKKTVKNIYGFPLSQLDPEDT